MKHNIVGIFIILVAASCNTQRMICPAYQSAFIHDEETLRKKFSYFGEDSMPKILEASKDKHLLIDPVTYRKKRRMLQTVAMVDIYPQEDDSVALDANLEAELALASQEAKSGDLYNEADLLKERPPEEAKEAPVESAPDSVYMISLKKEKFNIDQQLYLWYLREYLVYPDVKIQLEQNAKAEEKNAPEEEKVGFFKRLFGGKKNKEQAEIDPEEIADGETAVEEPKKKGFFSFLKKGDKPPKKKKEKKPKEEKEAVDNPAPDEEEDDGEDDF